MECPSCRQDLSRFEYIYRYCPLCNHPLPGRLIAGAGGVRAPARETKVREGFDNRVYEESPRAEPDPPFQVYWREESYKASRSNALEVGMEPAAEIARLSVKARFLSLGFVVEREPLSLVRKNTPLYFNFEPGTAGKHIVRLSIVCFDPKGNPTVFDTEDFILRVDETREPAGHTTYNIGDIFSTSEVSLGTKAKERRGSREEDAPMARLEVIYNDAETRSMRRGILIGELMTEAKELYEEGSGLIKASGRAQERKGKGLPEAFDLLTRAKERCVQVRQEDPGHEESLRYIGRIKEILAGPMNGGNDTAEKPHRTFKSCILHVPGGERDRNIFLFSKDRILIGKDESNDIATPGIEYISRVHALIKVNRYGEFFVRDVGTDGKGSRNGTFMNGRDGRIAPDRDYPIRDGTILNLGASLGLFCQFFFGPAKAMPEGPSRAECVTVTGERTDTLFGIDKWGVVNAVKIKAGNPNIKDEYVILMREITLGSRNTNGVVIKGKRVSDIHARLFYRDGLYMIEDLNSLHGTWVNGTKLEPRAEYLLLENALIDLGDATIRVELKS
jgi:pSer/pThr/pTyr-binding forkhead associated (FHA) protein